MCYLVSTVNTGQYYCVELYDPFRTSCGLVQLHTLPLVSGMHSLIQSPMIAISLHRSVLKSRL